MKDRCDEMRFKKLEIVNSSYIGIYASISNEFGLFPNTISKTDEKDIKETLDIDIVKINLGESIINGAISKIYKNKVVLSSVSTNADIKCLEKSGLDVLLLKSYLAVGNLIAVNDTGLLLSPEFSESEKKHISEFFGKKANVFSIGSVSLVGCAIALNNKNMAVFPHVSSDEFDKLKNVFKTDGNIATVNYGDGLIANGLLVNDKGVMIGSKTTGYEIIRLDDIFG